MRDEQLQQLMDEGFLRLPAGLGLEANALLGQHLESMRANGLFEKAGARNLLRDDPVLSRFANSDAMLGNAQRVLGPEAIPVRMILFDKRPEANWGVPWHQDLNVAVRRRIELEGYGPWTTKQGVPHVVPPAAVLEAMITLRYHIDTCAMDNGPLLVVPGSHRRGKISEIDIAPTDLDAQAHACVADPDDLFLMRPLLLHSSRKATQPGRRRVIHVEYAATRLPQGLDWYFASAAGSAHPG